MRKVMRESDSLWEDFWAYMNVQGEDVSALMTEQIRKVLVMFQRTFSSALPPEPAIDSEVLLSWDKDDHHLDLTFDRNGRVQFFYMIRRYPSEAFLEEHLDSSVVFSEPYLSYWKRMYK